MRRSWLPLMLLLAACESPTEQNEKTLRQQQGRWESLDLHDYSFEFRRSCFCGGPLQPLRVVVRGDSVVSVTDAATGETPEFLFPGWTGTIDEIFTELLEDAHSADSMELTFDSVYHFPTQARVDRIEDAVDDEYELMLGKLTPTP